MNAPAEVIERTPANARTGLQAMYDKGYIPAKLAGIDPHEVIARYLSDESAADIAKSYSVTRQALALHMLNYAEDDWKQAQIARAIADHEQAEENLKSAADALALSRARELAKLAQWRLERLLRRIYGDDRQVQVTVVPVLNISVAPLPVVTERLIDSE